MKKNLLILLATTMFMGCSSHFTFNGLICPVEDQDQIRSDLSECRIYDMKTIDKSLKDEKCKACIEAKGYRVDPNAINE